MSAKKQGMQDRAIAYHEAGHAVVAWYSGILVDHVSVVADQRFDGMTSFRPA